jgi:CDP-diacylglycerol pyrophosphatase
MNKINIIFTVLALIVLVGGSLLFEHCQKKIKDTTWLIVVSKIVIAIILIVIYGLILKWVAGLCHIEWKGD